MPDYTKSKIYKIVCNITGETYYGSTTQSLSVRIGGHRSQTKRGSNPTSSKQIIDRGNYDIVLCEECPCENKEQLHAIERRWIEANECVNKNIPMRTENEWREANKEHIREKAKEYTKANKERTKDYKETNKEHIREKQKEWREANKEYNKEWKEANKEYNKEQQKEWREANKEYYKEWREANKERLKQQSESKKLAKTDELISLHISSHGL